MTDIPSNPQPTYRKQIDLIGGLAGGAVAAVVELAPVLAIQSALGVSPYRVFQSIASGLVGRSAYAGGLGSVILGAGLHLFISLVVGILYAIAVSRLSGLGRRPFLGAVLLGKATYLVMSFIVVPLSAAAFPKTFDPLLMAISLAVHILAFALPITWILSRRRRRQDIVLKNVLRNGRN